MGRNTMITDARKLDGLLRNDFRAFIHKTFTTLCPGQDYELSWHIEAIAHRLERVRRGEIKRLIINMPPRSLKSIAASVAFPAFILGRDPSSRIICVSYSAELAKKHSNDFRAVLEAPWYQSLFPTARIGPYKNSETEIELTARGFRLATSVGGTLTGRGGDIIIIDDPLKPDDAMSETRRTAANQWFTNTLLSRLDDKRTGAIVIVMQRVHMDDLTGFVTGQSDEWEILNLPAVAEVDEVIPISDTKVHYRERGEALSPAREPLSVLESLKVQLGSDAFSAQYQQVPIPPGGAMIKRSWIQRYTHLPPSHERPLILQSWDTASKGGPENDFSVCTTWSVTRDRRWYLVDVWRRRVDYPALKAAVRNLGRTHGAKRVLVEDAGAGTSLVQELLGEVNGILAVKPDRDKISRMAVVSAKFESGLVFLPERAPWLPDLEAELFAFPGGRHDDQCDSVSQALADDSYSFPMMISAEALARSRQPGTRTKLGGGYYWPTRSGW
jgi:predicted phage terminase large subunit-like protein